ncbi:MAG: DUF4956 domain-containing protein [Lachnospiraceae bacterium]|jgi:hypothetical protein|nr:DUF4956 domain-containing protein [Lachnospiraceae bacterium]
MSTLFKGIFDTATTTVISVPNFLLCVLVALIIGGFLSVVYTYKSRYTKSFVMTLAMLPAIVCVVIMMVNGNIGAGVAVAGAFSLVRFRSVPGTAKDIGTIFLAMGAGLICGMGYLGYAILFSVILGVVMMVLTTIMKGGNGETEKILNITIPESLNYTEVFDDIMKNYTDSYSLNSVKTTNMGSLFKLQYVVDLKDTKTEKEFMDELRTRNGNLEISIMKKEEPINEL